MRPPMSYVYVLTNKNEPYPKIGKADDIVKRLKGLQTGTSAPWKVQRLIKAPREIVHHVETTFHVVFREFNIQNGGGNEFYDITIDQFDEVKLNVLYIHKDCEEIPPGHLPFLAYTQSDTDPHTKTISTKPKPPTDMEPETKFILYYITDGWDINYGNDQKPLMCDRFFKIYQIFLSPTKSKNLGSFGSKVRNCLKRHGMYSENDQEINAFHKRKNGSGYIEWVIDREKAFNILKENGLVDYASFNNLPRGKDYLRSLSAV